MNGFPEATTRDWARVMAVLKTYGLHKLLVGLADWPDPGSTLSTVLKNRTLNSRPENKREGNQMRYTFVTVANLFSRNK